MRAQLVSVLCLIAGCSTQSEAGSRWVAITAADAAQRIAVDLTRLRTDSAGVSDVWIRETLDHPPPSSTGHTVARIETHYRLQCARRVILSVAQIEYDTEGQLLISVAKPIETATWLVPDSGSLDAETLEGYCRTFSASPGLTHVPVSTR